MLYKPESRRATPGDHGDAFPLRYLIGTVWRQRRIALLVTALLTAAAVGFSLIQTPQYTASAELLVGQGHSISKTPADALGFQQLTPTVAQTIDSRPVAEAVIHRLKLRMTPEEFLGNLNVQQIPNTQLIEVDYQDPDPKRGQQIANTIGEVFSKKLSELQHGHTNGEPITVTVWQQAALPDEPTSPEPLRNGALALILGGLLGTAFALLLGHLDDSWHSLEELEQISGISNLGVIPQVEPHGNAKAGKRSPQEIAKIGKGKDVRGSRKNVARKRSDSEEDIGFPDSSLVTILEPISVASEAYRVLRTNLLYAFAEKPLKVMVLTSPGQQEGKSVVCANLGVVLAQAGKKTLVVDCDLRAPVMHKIFGLRDFRGLEDVVVGETDIREVWQEPHPNLKVVTAGSIPPNPPDLLGSNHFSKVLDQMRQEFDYVLLDTPPVELVSDPAILATKGDGVLLVADAQRTRKGAVRRSIRSLQTVGANVCGTVANNLKVSKDGYYHGGLLE
jgi:capsular exopolysaccharide synthesis family protein